MGKFKVSIGTDFDLREVGSNKSRDANLTIVVSSGKEEAEKKPTRPHILSLLTVLVCVMLTLGTASAYAYGVTTGDYTVLKAFPELIQKLLTEAIAMMASKK